MKAPMLLENYPPNRGQVICYTTTNIQDADMYTQSEKGTNQWSVNKREWWVTKKKKKKMEVGGGRGRGVVW